jgi:hypothetical protein
MVKDAADMIPAREPACSIRIANDDGATVIGPCPESIYNQDFRLPLTVRSNYNNRFHPLPICE